MYFMGWDNILLGEIIIMPQAVLGDLKIRLALVVRRRKFNSGNRELDDCKYETKIKSVNSNSLSVAE